MVGVVGISAIPSFISINDAIDRVAQALSRTVVLEKERTHIVSSIGRVLCENLFVERDRPEANLSAVDGYAIRSSDTIGASMYNPVELRLVGSLKPGESPQALCLEYRSAVRVYTGSPLPCGADAVVMNEDAEVRNSIVIVRKQIPVGSNVILRGEDLRKGEVIGVKGQIVGPAIVATLAASGISSVCVYRKIRIALIAIGSELVEPGNALEPGKEFNSTSYLVLSQLVKDRIYEPIYYGIVPDDPSLVEEAVLKAVDSGCDIVVTTGATGMSESDVIAQVMRKHNVLFRGVKMRPGRTTSCSLIGGRVVLHLSGFPVAAWTGYELLLKEAVQKWLELKGFERPIVNAILARRLPNVTGYTTLVRVSLTIINGDFYAEPFMLRGSGVLSSLLKTNGYVVIPEDVEGYERGTRVNVYMHAYW